MGHHDSHTGTTTISGSSGTDKSNVNTISPHPSNSDQPEVVDKVATTVGMDSTESSPLATTYTDPIVPLILQSLPRSAPVRQNKLVHPIVRDNRASATPTPTGNTPTSALQKQVGMSSQQDDLMTFSFTPSILAKRGNVKVTSENSSISEDGRQLEPQLPLIGGGDLIEFSLTPALLNKYVSNAVYSSRARNRRLDDRRTPSPLPPSPSQSSPQLPRQCKDLGPRSIPSSSSSPKELKQFPLDATSSLQHIHPNVATTSTSAVDDSKLFPKWEHFSEPTASPVPVAPQKMLPQQYNNPERLSKHNPGSSNAGECSGGNSGNIRTSRNNVEDHWTVISEVDPSFADDVNPAMRQLQQVASQHGIVDADKTLISTETSGTSSGTGNLQFTISRIPTESRGKVVPSLSSPSTEAVRSKFDPLPTPGVLGVDSSSKSKQRGLHDYAELDFPAPDYQRVGDYGAGVSLSEAKGRVSRSDYDEVICEPPVLGTGTEMKGIGNETVADKQAYSRLVDINTDVTKMVKMARNSAMPLGYDPDYAVPDQVAIKLQRERLAQGGTVKGLANSTSHQYPAVTRDRAHPMGAKVGGGMASSSDSSVAGVMATGEGCIHTRYSCTILLF